MLSKEIAREVVKEIDPKIGMHDFRAVIGATHTNLIFDLEIPFEMKISNDALIKNIETEIQTVKPECFCVITIDRC